MKLSENQSMEIYNKKKILIVPSWFSLDGLIGSFFREQAEIFDNDFDLRFLYGVEKKYNILNAISVLYRLKTIFGYKIHERENTCYMFDYPRFSFISSKYNFELKIFFYRRIFFKISKTEMWLPQLLHAQSTFDAGIIVLNLSNTYKIPFIITEHNLFLMHWYNKKVKDGAKKALESAARVLVVSNDKARQILMHGIMIDPFFVGNLINEKLFYYRRVQPHTTFNITIVGHYATIKDYPTFFKAMHALKKMTQRPLKISCLGYNSWNDYDNSNAIKSIAENLGLDNINFIGTVNRSEMNSHYWDSDVFVLTSIAEGLPVSVLEALACGRPVFTTRCGGVEDVIDHNNGVIVPVRDAMLLAENIINHLNGNLLFDHANISRNIIKKFGKDAFLSRLSGIYESYLNTDTVS